jgi:hypothetical protein
MTAQRPPTTRLRLRRRPDQHPYWCAADHTCSAATMTDGTHRSEPLSWSTPYGWFIATRVQHTRGPARLELRLVVNLPDGEVIAHRRAQHLVVAVDHAVRTITSRPRRRAA